VVYVARPGQVPVWSGVDCGPARGPAGLFGCGVDYVTRSRRDIGSTTVCFMLPTDLDAVTASVI